MKVYCICASIHTGNLVPQGSSWMTCKTEGVITPQTIESLLDQMHQSWCDENGVRKNKTAITLLSVSYLGDV